MPHRAAAMKITGERVASPEGGFNPTWQRHVAAYGLASRFLPSGTRARPRLRRRAQLPPARPARDGRRRHRPRRRSPARSARRSSPTCASCRSPTASSPRCSRSSRSSTCPTPSGCSPRSPGCSSPAASPCSSPRTGSRSAAPTRSSIRTTTSSSTAAELGRLCCATVRRGRGHGTLRLARATWRSSTRSARRSTALLARDPLRLRRLVPIKAKQRLYDLMLRRSSQRRATRAPRRSRRTTSSSRDDGLDAALDLCAVCAPTAISIE